MKVRGLDEFIGEHPPVAPVFWAFRIMVGTGMAMIAIGLLRAWMVWRRGVLPRWFLFTLVGMAFSGWVATVTGWYVTEIGRQPWLVQGVKTVDAVADHPPANVAFTLTLFLTTYVVLLIAFIGTLIYMANRAVLAASNPANEKGSPLIEESADVG